MSKKRPMEVQALYNLTRRVGPGSRLKIEFTPIIRENPHRGPALAALLRECAPEGQTAVVENNRRSELEAAAEAGVFKGPRTFFFKVAKSFDRYGPLHNAISCGLISRMQKA